MQAYVSLDATFFLPRLDKVPRHLGSPTAYKLEPGITSTTPGDLCETARAESRYP